MQIRQLSCARGFRSLPDDSALAHLDAGECEAISLASELQAILLLMDERDGVTIARHRGLKVVGTLAMLALLQPMDSSTCKRWSTGYARPRFPEQNFSPARLSSH